MSVIRKLIFNRAVWNFSKEINRTFSVTASRNNDPFIVYSDSSDIVLPEPTLTIPEVLFSAIDKFHNYIAIECSVTGKKYTYEQIGKKARNLSKVLRKKFKLNKGDVVAIYLPNCPDYNLSIIGTLAAGLVATTLNPMYTKDEVSKQLLDSGAKIIICQTTVYNNVKQALELSKLNIPVIVVKEKESDSLPDGAINYEELISTEINDLPDIVPGNTHDVSIMPYSSGTTGLPKGVLLTHSNLLSNLRQFQHPDFMMHRPPEGPGGMQDIVPMILPLYHIYGFTLGVLGSFNNGCRCVTLPKFTPETFVDLLKNHKITHLYAAPPLIIFMTFSADVKPEYLTDLIIANSGAAPLGYSDEISFKEKIQNKNTLIRQGYGLTETSPAVTITPSYITQTTEKNGGSIGKAMPSTVLKIIAPDDPKGTPLGPNKEGELLIKGPQVFQGYHNRPEETKNAFLDGWFRTGDIAYYNEDKFFFVTDRLKELIKVKGFQVPPAELEAVIRSYPSVEDAAVIGIPHPIQGEVPRAYVVVKKGQQFVPEELQQFVSSKVAKYKQLTGGVKVIDAVPKNPSGKILRRVLKDDYEQKGI